MRLKICRVNGLQLVVPQRFNMRRIPDILHKNQKWILRNWHHIAEIPSNHKTALPIDLDLLCLNEKWQIQYYPQETNHILLEIKENNILKITGNTQDNKLVMCALKKHLKQKARKYLMAKLDQLCQTNQLSYSALSIRDTQTRWGSCSAQKRISLNFKLLFLPPDIVEYVLIHELCHTEHLNHSKRFWQLVGRYCPKHLEMRQKLKEMSFSLPLWLEKVFGLG